MAAADKADLGGFVSLCVTAREWERLARRVHSARAEESESLSHYCAEPAAKGLAKKDARPAAKLYRALGLRIVNAGKSKYYNEALGHFSAGWPGRELSGKLAELLTQTLARADECEEKAPRTSIRLRNAFSEAISTWKLPETPEKLVKALAKLALREVSALLEAGNGAADRQAALLAAAVADFHYARGNGDAGERVFDGLLSRHDRKPDFKKEFNARRKLRSLAPLGSSRRRSATQEFGFRPIWVSRIVSNFPHSPYGNGHS